MRKAQCKRCKGTKVWGKRKEPCPKCAGRGFVELPDPPPQNAAPAIPGRR